MPLGGMGRTIASALRPKYCFASFRSSEEVLTESPAVGGVKGLSLMVTNVSFGQTSLGLTPFQFAFASFLLPSDTRIESCGKRSVLQTRSKDTTKIWNLQIIACANLSRMRFWRPKLTSIICNFARGIIYDLKFQILFVNNYHQLSTIIYNQKRAAFRLGLAVFESECNERFFGYLNQQN